MTVSFFIYIGSFLLIHYIRTRVFLLDNNAAIVLAVYLISWAAGGLASGSFRNRAKRNLYSRLNKVWISFIIAFGLSSIILSVFSQISTSRVTLVASFMTALTIEVLLEFIRSLNNQIEVKPKRKRINSNFVLLDFSILTIVLAIFNFYKFGVENLNENNLLMTLAIYLGWFVSSFTSHQFRLVEERNVWSCISVQVKNFILIIAAVSAIVFLLRFPNEYRALYLWSVFFYSLLSLVLTLYLFADKMNPKVDSVINRFLTAFEMKETEQPKRIHSNGKYSLNPQPVSDDKLIMRLKNNYLRGYDSVFSFIDKKLDLATFDLRNSIVIRSADMFNILSLPDQNLELFINLREMNDFRLINSYLVGLNKRLVDGGIYVGSLEPIRNRYQRFIKKYPFLTAHLFYFFDFIWYRIIPKIPVIRKILFAFTKGRNRALSLTEAFGRLYYCGFEIVGLKEIDNLIYFAVKKFREPIAEKNPSYSFIFKTRRQGKDGKEIFVYKIRTMHPYSEYLQEFIYEINNLEIGGKFKDDFRITKLGSILRKVWVDELPMLYNLIRGDIKLFGVRPISRHYLSLYSPEHQKRRLQYKPGLIPPFYSDMPETIEAIEKSESKYFDMYDKSPLKTDVIYFFRAFKNIVFRAKHSN